MCYDILIDKFVARFECPKKEILNILFTKVLINILMKFIPFNIVQQIRIISFFG